MADYQLEGPKPARMYEVILPKKLGYFGKVQEVLEDLFDEAAIRAIPFVRKSIARSEGRDPSFDEEGWIKTLCQASRGYSIYEMDGRYLSPQRPGRRAGAGDPVHLPQPAGGRSTPRPTSSPRRSRWSTTWSPTGSPRSWASRKKSGSSNTTSPGSPSGGGKRRGRSELAHDLRPRDNLEVTTP